MRNPRTVHRLITGVFLASLAGSAVFALSSSPKQPATPPPPTFGEQVDVRVVNVEVVVTDRHGLRVGGLAPADFRLKVDGRAVPIDYFTEVRGGDAVAPIAAARHEVQGLPSVAPGSPVGTSYLVFLDDYFAFGPNRDEALRNLKADLGRLGPEDRMAIVAYDGRHLEMLSSWTSSQPALARAIDEAMRRPALGLQRRGELAAFQAIRGAGGRRGGGFRGGAFRGDRGLERLNTEELPFAKRLAEQVEGSVGAAVATMRSFASPPGRKVMLLLAGGWPYSPGDYVVDNANRPILEQDVPGGAALLAPLDDTANLLGYTVYPVDVQGLQAEMAGADRRGPAPSGSFLVRPTEVRATLLTVASETGGQPILAGNHESPLAIAAADTRSYYWIGFTPEFKRDDARHKLKVEVAGPGLEVRARENYLDLSRRGEATMTVESAVLFGSPASDGRLPIEIGSPASSGWRQMDLPLTVAIPAADVTFVPLAGKYVGELELRVAALDKDGHRSDIPAMPFKLTLPERPEAGKFIRYETTVRLRKIDQRLTVAIVDPLSNRVLTASTEVKGI
jgi:VWFA-related protein